MKLIFATSALAAFAIAISPAIAATATAIAPGILAISGKQIHLANIKSPPARLRCTWRNRALDCGTLATAGLADLIAGANVICTPAASGRSRCTSNGYDISYGLIHSGWAIPANTAPQNYKTKMLKARQHKRGLWAARNATGAIVAETLTH